MDAGPYRSRIDNIKTNLKKFVKKLQYARCTFVLFCKICRKAC